MSKQSRNFSGVTYLDSDSVNSLFQSKFSSGVLRSFAFILHDRDTDENGNLKVPHIHFVLRVFNGSTVKTIRNWFSGKFHCDSDGVVQNTFVEQCLDVKSMYRYLTHADDADKFQYDPDLIVCSDKKDFLSNADTDTSFYALSLLIRGVPLIEVCRRCGRDFIYHYNSYKNILEDLKGAPK